MDPLSLFPLARGLPAPWEVIDVAFDSESGRIDCHLAFAPGTRFACPHYCGGGTPIINLFHDLDAQRVLYACEGRKARVVAQFADALEAHGTCAENIRAVCMDRSASNQAGV